MSKSIQMKTRTNEKVYPHPYYPIGSIYLSVNDTNPSRWFGGTWQLIAKGKTLVGVDPNDSDFNAPEKTGGEKTHTLTKDEMPQHNHEGLFCDAELRLVHSQVSGTYNLNWTGGGKGYGTKISVGSTGGNQPHNNMPPFFTCYIWCRTA